MKISIHDQENARVIFAEVPEYLIEAARKDNADEHGEAIAQAIFDALGLSSGNCEYMIGDDITLHIDKKSYLDTTRMNGIEELTQNFKKDALASLDVVA